MVNVGVELMVIDVPDVEPPYDLMKSCQLEFLVLLSCMLVVLHDPLASSPMPEKLALAPALTVFVFSVWLFSSTIADLYNPVYFPPTVKFVKTCVPYLSTILSAEYFWISDKNDGVKYLDNEFISVFKRYLLCFFITSAFAYENLVENEYFLSDSNFVETVPEKKPSFFTSIKEATDPLKSEWKRRPWTDRPKKQEK